MSSAYNPSDDVEGIMAAFFNHLARRRKRGFNARRTPENGFFFPSEAPSLWVKFGPDAPTIAKEARMQSYVYENWSSQENCRVPKIHRVFVSRMKPLMHRITAVRELDVPDFLTPSRNFLINETAS